MNVFPHTIFLRWGIRLSGSIRLGRSTRTVGYLLVAVRFYQIINSIGNLGILICCNKFTFGYALQKNSHSCCVKPLRGVNKNIETQDKRHSGRQDRAFPTGLTMQAGGKHQANAETDHAKIGSACTGRNNGDPKERNKNAAEALGMSQRSSKQRKWLSL